MASKTLCLSVSDRTFRTHAAEFVSSVSSKLPIKITVTVKCRKSLSKQRTLSGGGPPIKCQTTRLSEI
jgi:hypothetical protein